MTSNVVVRYIIETEAVNRSPKQDGTVAGPDLSDWAVVLAGKEQIPLRFARRNDKGFGV